MTVRWNADPPNSIADAAADGSEIVIAPVGDTLGWVSTREGHDHQLASALRIFGAEGAATILTGAAAGSNGFDRAVSGADDDDWENLRQAVHAVEQGLRFTSLREDEQAAVRRWFTGAHRGLRGRSPAMVMRSHPDHVIAAVQRWSMQHLPTLQAPYDRGRREERQRLLSRARELFGDPLAEVILTHEPAHLISLNAAAARSDEEIEPPRAAVSIANDLTRKEAKSTIQAWFVGLNPMLGDREPALMIRDHPDAVRDAALAFLASG